MMIFSTTLIKEIAYQKIIESREQNNNKQKICSTSVTKLTSCKHPASRPQILPRLTIPACPDSVTSNAPAPGPGEVSTQTRGSDVDMNTALGTCSSVRAPSLPEPLATVVDESTTVLALSKVRKVQHHSFQNKCNERNNSKVPFAAEGPEGFGIFFWDRGFPGAFQGRCWNGSFIIRGRQTRVKQVSAWAEAWVASLPPAEVEDGFPQQSLRSRKKLSG
jgi:hypothetical protein